MGYTSKYAQDMMGADKPKSGNGKTKVKYTDPHGGKVKSVEKETLSGKTKRKETYKDSLGKEKIKYKGY